MYKDAQHFVKSGLNSDTELRLFAVGDSRFRLNCRCEDTNRGNYGAIENVGGNVLVTYSLPVGTNKCVGTYEDKESNAIIYFIWNSNSEHLILRYYIAANSIQEIARTSLLEFDRDTFIPSINLLGNQLLWTDGRTEPKKINLPRMIEYTGGGVVAPLNTYTGLDYRTVSAMRTAPDQRPVVAYNSDVTKAYNNLRGKIFQFAYRWVYDLYERSANSPVSEVPLPNGEATITGEWSHNETLNNVIELLINTGSESVISIELMAREGNNGKWFVFDTVDKYNVAGTQLIASDIGYFYGVTTGGGFYNDMIRTATVDEETARLFDYVPQRADSQEVIGDGSSGSRVVYGGLLEGYDNIDTDATCGIVDQYIDLDAFTDSLVHLRQNSFLPNSDYYVTIGYNGHTWQNKQYAIRFYKDGSLVETIQFINPYANPLQLAVYAKQLIDASTTGNFAFTSAIDPINNNFKVYFLADKINENATSTIIGGNTEFFRTLKQGSYYDIGIVYYDKFNRSGGVQKLDRIYVPTYNQVVSPATPYVEGYLTFGVQTSINHLPPDWAVSYQLVRSQSSVKKSRFYQFNAIQAHASGNLMLMVNQTITDTTDALIKYQTPLYIPSPGDKVRLVGYTFPLPASVNATTIQNQFERDIIGQDTGGTGEPIVELDATWTAIQAALAGGAIEWCTVEIYSPAFDLSEDIYYEYGQTHPIVTDAFGARVHSGNLIHQSTDGAGNPFITAVNQDFPADSYVRKSIAIKAGLVSAIPTIQECISDFYDSAVWDYGRPNAYIKQMRQSYLKANIRYSQKWIDDTEINGTSTFYYDDYVKLSDIHGNVGRLIQTGYTLKALQPSKVTSIYIGRRSSFNPDGTESMLLTDAVLGTIRPYEEDLGCSNPESAVKVDRYIYFWDGRRGEVLRDSANGLQLISDYGMSNHFSNRVADLQNKKYFALGGFDFKHGEYILTFKEKADNGYIYNPAGADTPWGALTTAESVMFHEPTNKWKTFYSFIPEAYGWHGNTLVSFVNGALWVHNINPINNNFYGVQQVSMVDVYSHPDPDKVKVYKNMAIRANSIWSAPNDGDVLIPATDMYSTGMSSRLIGSKFKYKEGVYYSEFLRDINTPNVTLPLINGRPLRGHVLGVMLTSFSTDNTVLFAVTIDSIASEKS